jgi:hypothetical protein
LKLIKYLLTTICCAIKKQFPLISELQNSVTFYGSTDSNYDIATSIALKIASLQNESPQISAQTIIASTEWESSYIHSVPQNCNGYINFKISLGYINQMLYTRKLNSVTHLVGIDIPNDFLQDFEKIIRLVEHGNKIGLLSTDLQAKTCQLLTLPIEQKLIRALLIHECADTFQGKGTTFKNILKLVHLYYRKIPAITKDNELSCARLQLYNYILHLSKFSV